MARRPFFSSVLAYSSAVLGIAGLAFFCIIRVAYSVYYGHYGVSPEMLGLNLQTLLIQEASPINVVLLAMVVCVLLRGGWLFSNRHANQEKIQEELDKTAADSGRMVAFIGSGSATDVEAARREAARLEGHRRALSEKSLAAREGDRLVERKGIIWLSAALLLFALWSIAIIMEASLTPTGVREAQWFDPLQISVLSVTGVSSNAGQARWAFSITNGNGQRWLYLGSGGADVFFYDQVNRQLLAVPVDTAVVRIG
jgi:hypothetical protein